MKSDTTNLTWKPTLTMAKLFEEQNQFYDALAIYEIIGQSDDSANVRQKIEALQARILSDPNLRYDPRIEKLFSPEELAYLKILNHSAFENLSRMQTQFMQGAPSFEVDLEDAEPAMRPTVSSFEVRRMVEEIDTLAVPKAPVIEEPVATPEPIENKTEQKEIQTENFITPNADIQPLFEEFETPIQSEQPKSAAESLVSMLQREIAEHANAQADNLSQYIEPPADELESFHNDYQPQDEQPETAPEPEAEESTITDLAAELVKHFGKESKLDAISVQEFMQVVMKHKLQEKTDKPE